MIDLTLIFSVVLGIALLLVLILYLKLHAFISLLLVTIITGIFAGMPANEIFETMRNGMGSTLGFVAAVVGLGTLFGAILEKSGGAQRLASWMLSITGNDRAPWAMVVAGFLVSIPVFFDVAFIILVQVAYSLQRNTGKSLLLYALPLLAGLAITHAFIPPTPGPVAVADIINVGLGWVIMMGMVVGLPTAIISGPVFARFIADRISIEVPGVLQLENHNEDTAPSPSLIIALIMLPILLIVTNTILQTVSGGSINQAILYFFELTGDPFSALIIANLVAWYFLGIRRGMSRDELLEVYTRSIYPAGVIILLTGAGGAFKQILVETGAGEMIAAVISSDFFPPVVFAFFVSAVIRVLQGSATVAMITAAGITAPIIESLMLSDAKKAIVVIAIAAGATALSHVNDSGFWLVKQYLGMNEKQTLGSWTLMTTVIALLGLIFSLILWVLF
jgi:Gnt-I system low-affinity gluconate transporter